MASGRAARLAVLALALLAGACAATYPAARLGEAANAAPPSGVFVMDDGARLPYRAWLPGGAPAIVVLALHGFNDSYDAWELPAPALTAAGIAVIAPDQRGFGGAPERGRWAGEAVLTRDAAAMAGMVQRRFPRARLYLMGESMGAAVLMRLAGSADAPPVAGTILISPAVWGWSEMNPVLRASLWLTDRLAPGLLLGNGPIRVLATDNRAALIRLSEDPRTLRRSRVAAVKGLVDLMDQALHSAARLRTPTLVMYGGNDQLVPSHAMRAAWRRVPQSPGVQLAYYPAGYHLLLRDHDRARRIADIIAWLHAPTAPLPSGAQAAARDWLGPHSSAAGRRGLEGSGRTRSSAG